MTRYHHINGKRVKFTAEEETARDAEEAEWEAQQLATQYIRDRATEYPSIQECVHAILDDDLTALQKKRQTVKTKYPKS